MIFFQGEFFKCNALHLKNSPWKKIFQIFQSNEYFLGAQQSLILAGKELDSCCMDILRAAAPEGAKSANIDSEATKKLIDTVRSLATSTSQLVSSSAELSTRPKDQMAGTQLSAAAKAVTDA